MINRSPGGWGGGGGVSLACPPFPTSITSKQEGVRIRVKYLRTSINAYTVFMQVNYGTQEYMHVHLGYIPFCKYGQSSFGQFLTTRLSFVSDKWKSNDEF